MVKKPHQSTCCPAWNFAMSTSASRLYARITCVDESRISRIRPEPSRAGAEHLLYRPQAEVGLVRAAVQAAAGQAFRFGLHRTIGLAAFIVRRQMRQLANSNSRRS